MDLIRIFGALLNLIGTAGHTYAALLFAGMTIATQEANPKSDPDTKS